MSKLARYGLVGRWRRMRRSSKVVVGGLGLGIVLLVSYTALFSGFFAALGQIAFLTIMGLLLRYLLS